MCCVFLFCFVLVSLLYNYIGGFFLRVMKMFCDCNDGCITVVITTSHWMVYFKWVNILCGFYLNKGYYSKCIGLLSYSDDISSLLGCTFSNFPMLFEINIYFNWCVHLTGWFCLASKTVRIQEIYFLTNCLQNSYNLSSAVFREN